MFPWSFGEGSLWIKTVAVKILENGPEAEEEEVVVESYLEWVESGRIGLNACEQMGYHCLFGPEDKRGNLSTKRRTSFVQKRGCQCHFIVKVMHEIPNRAILTFNIYEHEDGEGWACYGQCDTSGETSGETRALHRPKLSRDVVAYVESCFFLGVPIDVVYRTHIKRHVDIDVADRDRDFFLCRKDIVNIYNRLAKGNYQLHKNDEMSVNFLYQKHREDFFFYQKPNGVEVFFIIGIQTKWMLETMVKLSHNSLIAMDSTFNTNKYEYQLYILVAFDEQQRGVLVAWVMASRNTSDDIAIWLEQLMCKCFQARSDWKVNAFMVDDALAEISALRHRNSFQKGQRQMETCILQES